VNTNILNRDTLEMVCNNLKTEAVEKIDFDALIDTLSDTADSIEAYESVNTELTYLKNEYRNRIIGMLKANLACRKNERDIELAARLTGDISEIDCDEMVRTYRRVASRFRANFPTSFGYLTMPSKNFTAENNWREFKI